MNKSIFRRPFYTARNYSYNKMQYFNIKGEYLRDVDNPEYEGQEFIGSYAGDMYFNTDLLIELINRECDGFRISVDYIDSALKIICLDILSNTTKISDICIDIFDLEDAPKFKEFLEQQPEIIEMIFKSLEETKDRANNISAKIRELEDDLYLENEYIGMVKRNFKSVALFEELKK